MDDTLYSKVLYENVDKGYQYRLTVSTFKDVEYIGIRKYYLSYEGEFVPSKEGATMPVTIEVVINLLDGLLELCSNNESDELLTKYFQEKIDEQISRVSK